MGEKTENVLENEWTFYYFEMPQKNEDWEKGIHEIGSFSTCEQFWSFYSHILPPEKLSTGLAVHLFKVGFKAMWEDVNIKNGGYITMRVPHRQVNYMWEMLILNMIGEQLMNIVIGACVTLKAKSDSIELWVDFKSEDEQEKEATKLDLIKGLIDKIGIKSKQRFEFTDFKQFKNQSSTDMKTIQFYQFDGSVVKQIEVPSYTKRQ